MTQISKGITFHDGDQVTGATLNQLVDSSTILIGAISDQTSLTSATVESNDQLLIADISTGTLKKTTVNDILGSSLPILASTITATSAITSAINAVANSDVVVTPYDSVAVTGKTFTSADGITATITSIAHGLVTGMVVNINASITAYSGQYFITASSVDSFSYSIYPTTTAASGTCSYTRKASERVIGNLSVIGEQYSSGNNTIGGNLRVIGTATINGKTPMTTQDNLIKIYVKSGQATGAWTTTTGEKTVWTSPVLPTPPSDETWFYEVTASFSSGAGQDANTRTSPNSLIGKLYKNTTVLTTQSFSSGTMYYTGTTMMFSTSITSTDVGVTVSLKANNAIYLLTENPWYTVRLTKVKTSTISDASTVI